mgnify:CR=1 FL=1
MVLDAAEAEAVRVTRAPGVGKSRAPTDIGAPPAPDAVGGVRSTERNTVRRLSLVRSVAAALLLVGCVSNGQQQRRRDRQDQGEKPHGIPLR